MRRPVHSWQVRRSDFDTLLFRNAQRKGADARERVRVTDIRFGAPEERATVLAQGPDGEALEFRPRYVLDASGRDTFLAGRMPRQYAADPSSPTGGLIR